MLEPHGEFRDGGHRKWTEGELVRDAHEWDALLVTSREQITERVIEAGTRLKLIAKIGVGVENIDIPAATKRKIPVTNCPGANAVAVAEAALGLMLAASRRIPQGMEKLREGGWREGIWISNEMSGATFASSASGTSGGNWSGYCPAFRAAFWRMTRLCAMRRYVMRVWNPWIWTG